MQYDPGELARYSLSDLRAMANRVVTPANAPTIQAAPPLSRGELDKAIGDLGFITQCLIAKQEATEAEVERERSARRWWSAMFMVALFGACFGVPFVTGLIMAFSR